MNDKQPGPLSRWLASAPLIALLFVFSGGLATLAFVVTYYNIVYSLNRISAIFRFGPGGPYSAPRGDHAIPEAIMPLMQDLSVVSPTLVTFTAFCMVYGCLRLLREGASTHAVGPHFPFPTSYKPYFIQIGLIGTIIGFVIAFSNIDPDQQGQSEVLLDALGTALWSTLTAITLAYVFCPLLELLYQWWLRIRTGYDPNPDTLSAIEELRQRTVSATVSLDDFARSVNALSNDLNALQLQHRLARLEQGVEGISVDIDSLKQHVKALHDDGLELRRRTASIENGERERERGLDDIIARLDSERRARAGLDQRVANMEQTVGKLLDQLKKALE